MKMSDIQKKKGRISIRPSEEELAELYATHTATEIAEKYGVTVWAVRNWIKHYRDLGVAEAKKKED